MKIRPERREEFPLLYEFVRTAFATAKVSDGTEQDFVDRLRAGSGYLPALALVAEEDGALLGHIMFTETRIRLAAGGERTILLLAPLAVALEHRGRGIGSALVREGFRIAREMGYGAVALCGDPAYYGRFGFRESAGTYGIVQPGMEARYCLACELVPSALGDAAGELDLL